MKRTIKITIFLFVLFSGFCAFGGPSEKFAGKRAECSGGPGVETFQFVGISKEYTKNILVAGQKIEQKGKYEVKKDTLKLSEFQAGTKDINPERVFEVKYELTETGFEYIWKTPKGKEMVYTCRWLK